jgi:hypothetical protein
MTLIIWLGWVELSSLEVEGVDILMEELLR